MNILTEADQLTSQDRNKQYGHPYDNHGQTARMWTSYLERKLKPGESLDAEDVCMMQVLIKISRNSFKRKRDNLVDGAGYFRNVEMINDFKLSNFKISSLPEPETNYERVVKKFLELSPIFKQNLHENFPIRILPRKAGRKNSVHKTRKLGSKNRGPHILRPKK